VVVYIGDVAIYVSSYKVCRFEDARKAIEKTIFDKAVQIYSLERDAAGAPYI
jgi:hypothetical protein